MRKLLPLIAIIIVVSYCGKKGEGGNRPPRIDRAMIDPEVIYTGDDITLTPTISDPDGDKVKLTYNWYKNGKLLPNKFSKLSTELRKGDRIEAEIVPNDGKISGKSYKIGPLAVVNTPPEITSYAFDPYNPSSDTTITLTVNTRDGDGDRIELDIGWEIDGEEILGLKNHQKLLPGDLKRDQKIIGLISAFDGEDYSRVRTEEITVGNGAPRLTSYQTGYKNGNFYIYLKTADPDGDPVSIRITSGPDDLSVDSEHSSLVLTSPKKIGVYNDTVVIELSDSFGGKSENAIPISIKF